MQLPLLPLLLLLPLLKLLLPLLLLLPQLLKLLLLPQLKPPRSNFLHAKKNHRKVVFFRPNARVCHPGRGYLMSSAITLTMRCAVADFSGAPLASRTDTVVTLALLRTAI